MTNTPPQDALIRRVLGNNVLELKLKRLAIEEFDYTTLARVTVAEGEQNYETEGKGIGAVDAIFAALLERYAREYQSLKSITLVGFHVSADMETKKAQTGADSVGKVTIDVQNSEGRRFTFSDTSRSVTISIARAVLAVVQYFVSSERAFVMLCNAQKDAKARGREDLVSRYTAELAEVVESTSYAEVIENMRKELK